MPDRVLVSDELEKFTVEPFALEAIRDSSEVPSLYDVAFLEVKGHLIVQEEMLVLITQALIDAGLLDKGDFMGRLGR